MSATLNLASVGGLTAQMLTPKILCAAGMNSECRNDCEPLSHSWRRTRAIQTENKRSNPGHDSIAARTHGRVFRERVIGNHATHPILRLQMMWPGLLLTVRTQKPCSGLLLEKHLLGNTWIDPQCAASQFFLLKSTHFVNVRRNIRPVATTPDKFPPG